MPKMKIIETHFQQLPRENKILSPYLAFEKWEGTDNKE